MCPIEPRQRHGRYKGALGSGPPAQIRQVSPLSSSLGSIGASMATSAVAGGSSTSMVDGGMDGRAVWLAAMTPRDPPDVR